MPKSVVELRKIRTDLIDNNVEYFLGKEDINLNSLIGNHISLKFTGNIYCIDTGKKITKSYGNGFSYESFISKAQCDVCIMQPEKCHYHLGTCREPQWGEKHCFQSHIVYLSMTPEVKVGITRKTQIPTRWIDQGASFALAIIEVPNRLASGLIEELLKNDLSDKTHWKKMLSSDATEESLKELAKSIITKYEKEILEFGGVILEDDVQQIYYPISKRPESFKSTNFDKEELVSGNLIGIKGQYLFIDQKVINIRRHQGYEVEIDY